MDKGRGKERKNRYQYIEFLGDHPRRRGVVRVRFALGGSLAVMSVPPQMLVQSKSLHCLVDFFIFYQIIFFLFFLFFNFVAFLSFACLRRRRRIQDFEFLVF